MKNKRDDEIARSILEWLMLRNYPQTAETFIAESKIPKNEASTGNKLEKKWGTILSLQKKITDLEQELKQLKEDMASGSSSALQSQSQKDAAAMGLPKSLSKSTIKGHRLAVTCVCFHPYYKRLATGSDDASIIVWECDEFTEEKSLKAHSASINHLCFDINGKLLASCSSDLTVKIWNFDTMTVHRTLNGHEHTVSSCVFSLDGNFLFSASRDKTIKYWEINSGNCLKTLDGHDEWVRSVSISMNGNLLASSSDDEKILIWDTETYVVNNELIGHKNKIECIFFIQNQKAVENIYMSEYAGNFKNSLINNENINNKEPKTKEEEELAKINEKLLMKKQLITMKEKVKKDYLLSASRDKTIMLWDVRAGISIYTFTGHDNWVRSLTEHPNGKFFASCSDDKTIRIWDFKNGLCAKKLMNAHDKFIVSVSFSPKCKMLASGSSDLTVKIWDCS